MILAADSEQDKAGVEMDASQEIMINNFVPLLLYIITSGWFYILLSPEVTEL